MRPTDDKDQRLKELQTRFRKVGWRQDFLAGMKRRARQPYAWVLAFLVLAAILAMMLAYI